MDWSALLTRRTTPGQRTVAFWTLVALLIVTGAVAAFFSTRAGQLNDAAQLRSIAYWSFGLAAVMVIIKKAIGVYVDS